MRKLIHTVSALIVVGSGLAAGGAALAAGGLPADPADEFTICLDPEGNPCVVVTPDPELNPAIPTIPGGFIPVPPSGDCTDDAGLPVACPPPTDPEPEPEPDPEPQPQPDPDPVPDPDPEPCGLDEVCTATPTFTG